MSDDALRLLTVREFAEQVNLKRSQVDRLIRDGQLAYVRVGQRKMVHRQAWERFLSENTETACPVETKAPVYTSSRSEASTTSSGRKAVEANSAARALQTASRLKSRSRSSCTNGSERLVHVLPMKS